MLIYYANFKHFVNYNKQIDLIAQAIESYFRSEGIAGNGNFRFLDVGANDGTLTDRIAEVLKKLGKKPDVTALEPDKAPYKKLDKKPFRTIKKGLEDWLTEDTKPFDLILCSHSFYHIPEEKWQEVTNRLRQRLNDNGNLIVTLDSDDSEIYRLRNKLELPTKIRDFGEYLFARDYQRMLEDKGIPYKQRTINSLIEIPSDEEMIIILAFLYRTQQTEIKKYADEVKKFMKRFRTKEDFSVFDWRQEMFIINI